MEVWYEKSVMNSLNMDLVGDPQGNCVVLLIQMEVSVEHEKDIERIVWAVDHNEGKPLTVVKGSNDVVMQKDEVTQQCWGMQKDEGIWKDEGNQLDVATAD